MGSFFSQTMNKGIANIVKLNKKHIYNVNIAILLFIFVFFIFGFYYWLNDNGNGYRPLIPVIHSPLICFIQYPMFQYPIHPAHTCLHKLIQLSRVAWRKIFSKIYRLEIDPILYYILKEENTHLKFKHLWSSDIILKW